VVQPRFFCGQLLTDQDLTRLVTWTGDRLRLARYRDGWGVACGLEVRCDPRKPGGVLVGPGYAMSCCGEDVIVCEDTPLDLSSACQEAEDPCADLRPQKPTEQPATGAAGGTLGGFHPVGGDADLVAVDLTIGYHPEEAAFVTALAGGACNGSASCEHSQVKESFKLTVRQVQGDTDPAKAAAAAWRQGWERCSEVLAAFGRRFTSFEGNGEAIRRWLVEWIDSHPLRQFCFVREWICTLDAKELASEATVAGALFWLVQDCRNAYVTCACHDCGEGHSVPLARVWLRRSSPDAWTGEGCSVVRIDACPPFRRPIGRQCWPAPLGAVNGGQVLWHRWPEACSTLAGLGVRVGEPVPLTLPDTVAGLETELRCSPFLACGEPVIPQVLDLGPDGQRVVGFCGGGRDQQRATDVEAGPQAQAKAVPAAEAATKAQAEAEEEPAAEAKPAARRATGQRRPAQSSGAASRGGRRERRDR
jgi:hypothetical protein